MLVRCLSIMLHVCAMMRCYVRGQHSCREFLPASCLFAAVAARQLATNGCQYVTPRRKGDLGSEQHDADFEPRSRNNLSVPVYGQAALPVRLSSHLRKSSCACVLRVYNSAIFNVSFLLMQSARQSYACNVELLWEGGKEGGTREGEAGGGVREGGRRRERW